MNKILPLQNSTNSHTITRYYTVNNITISIRFHCSIILDALHILWDEGYTSNNRNITHEQTKANWYFISTNWNFIFCLPSLDLHFFASFLHLSASFLHLSASFLHLSFTLVFIHFIQDLCSTHFSFSLQTLVPLPQPRHNSLTVHVDFKITP